MWAVSVASLSVLNAVQTKAGSFCPMYGVRAVPILRIRHVVLMSVLLYMHTIGAHYTFERVPFDRFSDFFGFERNHYDRIAHFSV